MTRLEELELKKAQYQNELEQLHVYEPSESWYKARRNELELLIYHAEEAIEDEKESLRHNANMSNVFIVILYALVITGLTILIFM